MVTIVNEFTSAAVSDRGLNEARPQNEDSFLELPQYGIFAVADGVGGAQAGEVASQMAVEILGEAFANMAPNADPEHTMRIALERANEAIFQMARDLPQLASMATTIAAVHVAGDMATIGHVGDSRVYRVDQHGRIFRETDDHSIVEEEVRAGRMTPEQAANHPSRNVISRALGAEETVQADIKCVLVGPATTFLLCSDGITRHIEDAEIQQLLTSEFGPEDVCSRMKEICFSRGAEDNLTAVIVNFPGDRQPPPAAAGDDEGIDEITLPGVRETPLDEADTFESIDIQGDAPAAEPADAVTSPQDRANAAENPEADDVFLIESPPEGTTEKPPSQERPLAAEEEAKNTERFPPVQPLTSISTQPASVENVSVSWLVPSIGLFIAGLLLGAMGGYFLLRPPQTVVEVPPAPAQQSSNIPMTAFETTRRLVDDNPAAYLNANAASPQEADDFFWLGRALLLTGKPIEARRQFEEARGRLATFDDRASARTMANEIAMALAILDSPRAIESFTRESAANSVDNGNSNAR